MNDDARPSDDELVEKIREARADVGEISEELAAAREEQEIPVTAPMFPWEIVLHQSVTYFQKRPGGGMLLKFVPAIRSPSTGRAAPMPPAVVLDLSGPGWESFKETVANDGVPPPAAPSIETARIIPPGFKPPGVG